MTPHLVPKNTNPCGLFTSPAARDESYSLTHMTVSFTAPPSGCGAPRPGQWRGGGFTPRPRAQQCPVTSLAGSEHTILLTLFDLLGLEYLPGVGGGREDMHLCFFPLKSIWFCLYTS